MGIQFDKFTDRARKVLNLAQEEAQRFNHNYIGTEHLLLGLVREGDGVAAMVLSNLGVELNKVRSAVEFIIGRGDRIVLGEIGLTPRAKKVIELAVDEARRLNHHYIGTEHLLLGLVREGEGIAAGVLSSLGVNLEMVRTETIRVLAARGTPTTPRSGWRRMFPSGLRERMAGGGRMAFYGPRMRPTFAERTTIWLAVGLAGASVAEGLDAFADGVPARLGLSAPVAGALLGVTTMAQAGGIALAARRSLLGYVFTGLTGAVWAGVAAARELGALPVSSSTSRAGMASRGLTLGVMGLGTLLTVASGGVVVSLLSLQRRMRGGQARWMGHRGERRSS